MSLNISLNFADFQLKKRETPPKKSKAKTIRGEKGKSPSYSQKEPASSQREGRRGVKNGHSHLISEAIIEQNQLDAQHCRKEGYGLGYSTRLPSNLP